MACALIAAALDAGAPCAWVLADALYGSDSRLRRMLETREQPYGLAVRSNHHLRVWTEQGLEETNPAAMADALASEAWVTHAAGEAALLGADFRRRAHLLVATAWGREPTIGGSYAYAKPGAAGQRAVLAAPVDGPWTDGSSSPARRPRPTPSPPPAAHMSRASQ